MKKLLKRAGLVAALAGVVLAGLLGWASQQQTLARGHNYDLQDGLSYGYTAALSQTAQESGQVGQQVFLVKYAGQRGGTHQLHLRQGALLVAMECAAPCDLVRVMTVMDVPGVPAQPVLQVLRNAPGMLAGLALDDALNGRLAEYRDERGARVWVDATSGVSRE